MDETTKYLIHARIAANGVVERSDVVGAVFGQTEGLLGDELDLRDLQQSSKVGRIDVEISSENGQSFGELAIATSLDKAETAILGASLETIERVGPCRADIEVTEIEDVRAAKRREVVERAKELLATAFDETIISTEQLVADVRESVRVEDLVEYAGLPAGPSVESSDAIIVVEGRADVRRLLQYGIKNAIAVEGTDVPDAVADLTAERTTTVFVDGDRGGELILRELLQVGDVDFVAFAPAGRSVEDLSRGDVLGMLRRKVAASRLADRSNIREAIAEILEDGPDDSVGTDEQRSATSTPASTDGSRSAVRTLSTTSAEEVGVGREKAAATEDREPGESTGRAEAATNADRTGDETNVRDDSEGVDDEAGGVGKTSPADGQEGDDKPAATNEPIAENEAVADDEPGADSAETDRQPATLRRHVREVIDGGRGVGRLLDAEYETLTESDLDSLVEAIDDADDPFSLVVDGECSQRMLDAAAQRGIDHVVASETGEFVKKPVGTRVLTADQLRAPEPEIEA